MDNQQQQLAVYQPTPPPPLRFIAGVAAIGLIGIFALKAMWQREIDHWSGIPPS